MAEQEKKQRPSSRSEEEAADGAAPEPGPVATAQGSEGAMGKLDDVLDEIDEVLESNAEEFVKNYVQKGGE